MKTEFKNASLWDLIYTRTLRERLEYRLFLFKIEEALIEDSELVMLVKIKNWDLFCDGY